MMPLACRGRWLALVGMMGAGKSTVGRKLAQHLQVPFVDLDARIEAQAEQSIPALFAAKGEGAFRVLEQRCLRQTLRESPPGVLATGGGVTVDPNNAQLLMSEACTVYLELGVDRLVPRLNTNSARAARPLLPADCATLRERLKALLDARRSGYEQAQVRVDGARAPELVLQSILSALSA